MQNSIPNRIGPYQDIGEKHLLESFSAYLAELQTLVETIQLANNSVITVAETNRLAIVDVKSKLKGDYLVSKPGLGIGTTPQDVANIAFAYQINGVQYPKPAIADGTALSGDDIPQNQYGAFRLEIGINGTVDIVPATGNATGYTTAELAIAGLPVLTVDHSAMGTVTVMDTAGAFSPGTTSLASGTVTEVYADGQTVFEAIEAVPA